MVKHLYVTLGFHIEGLFHRGLLHEYRDVTIQYIYLFMGITHHASGYEDAAQADNHAAHQKEAADDHHHFDLVFQIL